MRVRLTVFANAGLLESVIWNVRGVLETKTVGVPVMAPVEALRESPAGRVPLASDQV